MRIDRQELLDNLEMVKPGLSPREFIEQSSCFAFKDGEVMTFNDEVSCRMGVKLTDVTGAVQAQALLDILGKLEDDTLEVTENNDGQLEFQGKRKAFAITKDREIFLPVDRIEQPKKWSALDKEFLEAVGLVQHCVSQNESQFFLTCIHITKDYIEACDNHQILRVRLNNAQFEKSALVRGASLAEITSLAMNQVSKTENWVHFTNDAGLVYSCRRYADEYPSLDESLKLSAGHPVIIPKGLIEATDRAAVFASDRVGDPLVTVEMRSGAMRITGEGATGWYKEFKKIAYEGPDIKFLIAPDLLKHISDKYKEATISSKKFKASGGQWEYATVLGAEEEQEEAPRKKKQEED